MVVVAIAGGTSPTLGRSIATAIQTTTPENRAVILTRTSPSALATIYDCEVRQVDYDSPESLAGALLDVHTVISVIKSPGPAWLTSQLALLSAAKTVGVKRFAPSAFEFGPKAEGKVELMAGIKRQVWQACLESGLEVAQFAGGGFMNYLLVGFNFGEGVGADRARNMAWGGLGEEEPAYIWRWKDDAVDLLTKEDGSSAKVTLTSIDDIGRFVAAACTLPDGSWKHSMQMVGETIDLQTATATLEDISGTSFGRKSTVKRSDLEQRLVGIQGTGNNIKEIVTKLVTQLEMVILDGEVGGGVLDPIVNELCPHVKPSNVREFLEEVFSKMEE